MPPPPNLFPITPQAHPKMRNSTKTIKKIIIIINQLLNWNSHTKTSQSQCSQQQLPSHEKGITSERQSSNARGDMQAATRVTAALTPAGLRYVDRPLHSGACMRARLPLIHSTLHLSEPSHPTFKCIENPGPPMLAPRCPDGGAFALQLSVMAHSETLTSPSLLSPSLLSSGAAPASACSIFRGSKKSSRRSKNSSACTALSGSCLLACRSTRIPTRSSTITPAGAWTCLAKPSFQHVPCQRDITQASCVNGAKQRICNPWEENKRLGFNTLKKIYINKWRGGGWHFPSSALP